MTLHIRKAFEEPQIPAPPLTTLTLRLQDMQVLFSATHSGDGQGTGGDPSETEPKHPKHIRT